jgi:hypothetical protein
MTKDDSFFKSILRVGAIIFVIILIYYIIYSGFIIRSLYIANEGDLLLVASEYVRIIKLVVSRSLFGA